MGNALNSTKNCFFQIMGWENDSLMMKSNILTKGREHSHSLFLEDLNLENFAFEKELGKGGFGRVILVRKIGDTKKGSYALKLQSKQMISRHKMMTYFHLEKTILRSAKHPFIVKLKGYFETDKLYCLLMEYLPGGHLFSRLKDCKKFTVDVATFYISEIVLALIHLHKNMNVIYRDLKPENILLNSDGHIKLADFGLCRVANEEAHTFAGTIEYMAPEILMKQGYGKNVDWWTLGILIYEMLRGYSPFKSTNRSQIQSLIIENKPTFPSYFPEDAVDLLKKLLVSDPALRLGDDKIMQHTFFKKVCWDELLALKVKPPTLESIKDGTFIL